MKSPISLIYSCINYFAGSVICDRLQWTFRPDILVRVFANLPVEAASVSVLPVEVAVSARDVRVAPVIDREIDMDSRRGVDVRCDAGFK